MKVENKQSVKMDFVNCEIKKMDDRIFIIEYDKDNNPIGEFELLEELEEALILSDIGIETSQKIIGKLREKIKKQKIEGNEDKF